MFLVTVSDGPCETKRRLRLRRSPIFMRFIIDAGGQVDALDLEIDKPDIWETVYAYRFEEDLGTIHYNGVENGKRVGAWIRQKRYVLCENQPSEEVLRDNEKWKTWCLEEHKKRKGN